MSRPDVSCVRPRVWSPQRLSFHVITVGAAGAVLTSLHGLLQFNSWRTVPMDVAHLRGGGGEAYRMRWRRWRTQTAPTNPRAAHSEHAPRYVHVDRGSHRRHPRSDNQADTGSPVAADSSFGDSRGDQKQQEDTCIHEHFLSIHHFDGTGRSLRARLSCHLHGRLRSRRRIIDHTESAGRHDGHEEEVAVSRHLCRRAQHFRGSTGLRLPDCHSPVMCLYRHRHVSQYRRSHDCPEQSRRTTRAPGFNRDRLKTGLRNQASAAPTSHSRQTSGIFCLTGSDCTFSNTTVVGSSSGDPTSPSIGVSLGPPEFSFRSGRITGLDWGVHVWNHATLFWPEL